MIEMVEILIDEKELKQLETNTRHEYLLKLTDDEIYFLKRRIQKIEEDTNND